MKDNLDVKCLGVNFEFSRPRKTQKNGKVERKFQTCYVRTFSTLYGGGLKDVKFGWNAL
jgi:hypothetical protein